MMCIIIVQPLPRAGGRPPLFLLKRVFVWSHSNQSMKPYGHQLSPEHLQQEPAVEKMDGWWATIFPKPCRRFHAWVTTLGCPWEQRDYNCPLMDLLDETRVSLTPARGQKQTIQEEGQCSGSSRRNQIHFLCFLCVFVCVCLFCSKSTGRRKYNLYCNKERATGLNIIWRYPWDTVTETLRKTAPFCF